MSRPRLVARLQQGRLERRATLLCAPPGYGKSTVLQQVSRVWLRLGVPVVTPVVSAAPFPERLAAVLATAADTPHPQVLMIDDLPSLDVGWELAIAEAIERFPRNGHVVLALRHAPPSVVRSAVHKVSHEIVLADDLRFTLSECVALLRSRHVPELATEWGRELHRLTAGWPVAVDVLADLADRFGRVDARAGDAELSPRGETRERYVRERMSDLHASAVFRSADVYTRREEPPQLTEREREVLSLLAHGKENRAIAKDLFLSVATVKSHILRIFRKLDVHNRTAAVAQGRALRVLER